MKRLEETWKTDLLEMFRGDFSLGTKVLVEEDEDGGQNGEERTKTEDDEVAHTFGKGSISSEVGVNTPVLEEGRGLVVEEVEIEDLFSSHGEDDINRAMETSKTTVCFDQSKRK